MNCPKCGAEAKSSGYLGTYFDCGSSYLVELDRSSTCRELCDLRKWREVVLRHARLGEYAWGQLYWASSIPALQTLGEQRPHQNFDSAVRKEMECES